MKYKIWSKVKFISDVLNQCDAEYRGVIISYTDLLYKIKMEYGPIVSVSGLRITNVISEPKASIKHLEVVF